MKKNERVGQWIQTFSGVSFYPLDPRKEEIKIEDIAHSLSLICRYNGHTKFHYSVAQHSWIIAVYLWNKTKDPQIALQGLLHDASEAYICDIPRPLKPSLTNYKDIEANIMEKVCDAFGLDYNFDPLVKECDDKILNDERSVLLKNCGKEWAVGREFLGVDVYRMQPSEIEKAFLEMYYYLDDVRLGFKDAV